MLLSNRPARRRARETWTRWRRASRPTSSGGGLPAPGEKGFLMGSIEAIIRSLWAYNFGSLYVAKLVTDSPYLRLAVRVFAISSTAGPQLPPRVSIQRKVDGPFL